MASLAGWALVGSVWAVQSSPPTDEVRQLLHGEFVGCTNIAGLLLGVDEARAINDSTGAQQSAESRAQTFATGRLLAYSLRGVKWPSNLSAEVTDGLTSSYFRLAPPPREFHGLQHLGSWNRSVRIIRAVVYLPEPDSQIPSVDLAQVRQSLGIALAENPDRIDLAAYLEFCSESEIPKVVELLAKRMSKYGKGTAATLAGEKVSAPSDFLPRNDNTAGTKSPKNRGEWFSLLGSRPYDPAVCLALGNLMQQSGYPRAASLIYNRGGGVFVGRADSNECRRKAGKYNWLLSYALPQPEIPYGFTVELAKRAKGKIQELPPTCRLIVESAGHLPVEASAIKTKAYDEAWKLFTAESPNLTNSLQYAIQSLEEGLTADALNLVGRIYMLQGDLVLAIPFLEQARYLESTHPYATGNLALALFAFGEKTIAVNVATSAMGDPRTANDLKNKLNAIIDVNSSK